MGGAVQHSMAQHSARWWPLLGRRSMLPGDPAALLRQQLPCPAGARIGLIDYGQSKRLPDSYRAAFARLVLALCDGNDQVG